MLVVLHEAMKDFSRLKCLQKLLEKNNPIKSAIQHRDNCKQWSVCTVVSSPQRENRLIKKNLIWSAIHIRSHIPRENKAVLLFWKEFGRGKKAQMRC